uniref:pyruvate decarboxylase n=1 Tax=Arcella intermedia TaxID=1963864 RepID=A0A6B2L2B6_9EUKA
MSLVNAIAGAYSDDLPVVVVSGGPNSNDLGTNRVLHHTMGLPDRTQQLEVFRRVTQEAVVVTNAIDAPELIDKAFSTALRTRKPVYIEICCNIAQQLVPTPVPMAIKYIPDSNQTSLQHALQQFTSSWNSAVKPVLLIGNKVRLAHALRLAVPLAEKLGAGVAVMPNAKSFFPETHPQFMGTYWGNVSSPYVCEVVESADLYVYIGPVFNDYTTTGYSTLVQKHKMIQILPERVKMPLAEYGCVYMTEFLEKLLSCKELEVKNKSLEIYKRIAEAEPVPVLPPPSEVLSTRYVLRTVQRMLRETSAVIVETGDSWFNGQKLHLPRGVPYEFQMQYGSIGWSVGALLGMALGFRGSRRCIAMIGDGSFQMTAQEVSTMIRYGLNPIIFLLNNQGYTIEVEIHDGPYNNIKNWDYKMLIDAFSKKEGKVKSFLCNTVQDLNEGVEFAEKNEGHLVFLECSLDRNDCSKELLEWGTRVASANGRAAIDKDNY